MSEHTPDTEEVAYYYEGPDLDAGDRRAAFERWLAETIRQARAEAWEVGRAMGLSDHSGSMRAGRPLRTPNPYAEEADHE